MYEVIFELFKRNDSSSIVMFKQQFEHYTDALKVYEGFNIPSDWNRLSAGIIDEFRHRDYCLNLFQEGAVKLERVK